MSAGIDARERTGLLRGSGIALVITLAFAAPATLKIAQGLLGPNESRLGDAIANAFGGVTLPLVAAAVVASVLGAGSPLRARADRLVAAGAEPRSVIMRPLAIAMLAATLASALGSALTVLLLRGSLRLGTPGLLITDLFATAWGTMLGAAAWTGCAALLVIRSGRPARAWIVVVFDLVSRLLPGAAAWLAPSAHIENVLGAPPPRGFVHVPVLPQLASVAVLLLMAALFAFAALRRYDGAPAR